MRLVTKGDGALERVAIASNQFPVPLGEAFGGMAASAALIAVVRLGITDRLVHGPASAEQLASELGLAPEPTRLLLDALVSQRHLARRRGRYVVRRRDRKWLDRASPSSIVGFVEACHDYWQWWGGLEDVVRTGVHFEVHDLPADDPYWARYMRGQYDLAHIYTPEVAKALKLDGTPRTLLDVAGGHGYFSAALCRAYPGLHSTVVDLEGSVAIGREIAREQGYTDVVDFEVGDALTSDLGGPYDVALCFNLIHHLTDEQNTALFARIRATLRPGATLAVLDLFHDDESDAEHTAAAFALFFYLHSGTPTVRHSQLRGWLADAGFAEPSVVRILRLPVGTLYVTHAV